ncbi:MAG: DUF1464 family protein [Chloroflexota bacterium]|nr:DUF1464 family protein [Chloroflexota bacterium]
MVDRSIPTADALANPAAFASMLRALGADLIAGPSGYGLPLTTIAAADDRALRLAYLSAQGERGGIGGLRALAAAMVDADLPVVFTPGVIHLRSVPAHRKINRVDLGTADKVCAAALGIREQAARRGCALGDVSFILLELGGAFSAAIAVSEGRIVDGAGGSAGPLGMRAAGALDGEVAFLAGDITKELLFRGGVESIVGRADVSLESLAESDAVDDRLAWNAFVESAVKTVAALRVSVSTPHEILLSGRVARAPSVVRELHLRLSPVAPVRRLQGYATVAKEAAQGAALIADGLAGGRHAVLTDVMGIRDASGTALDYLRIITPEIALRRLGL